MFLLTITYPILLPIKYHSFLRIRKHKNYVNKFIYSHFKTFYIPKTLAMFVIKKKKTRKPKKQLVAKRINAFEILFAIVERDSNNELTGDCVRVFVRVTIKGYSQ